MKTNSIIRTLVIALFAISISSVGALVNASVGGAGSDTKVQASLLPTITDIVSGSGGDFDQNESDFDILLNAVIAAGLADALGDRSAELTVLAPNDKAFVTLAQDLGYEGDDEAGAFEAIVAALTVLGDGDPIPVLTNVLLYHVLPDGFTVRTIIFSNSARTLLSGVTITPDKLHLVDNEPDIENARFIIPVNQNAANGLIHTVNRVLLPIDLPGNTISPTGTIVDIVAASGGDFDNNLFDYDILLNAVLAADLAGALSDPSADLTVFAPNDAAFLRLANDLGYIGESESEAFDAIVAALTELGGGDPIPVLTNILLYHVSAGSQTVKEVSDTQAVDTLLADTSFGSFGTFLLDNAPKLLPPKLTVMASDIRATNGIVHTISRVLIPLDLTPTGGQLH